MKRAKFADCANCPLGADKYRQVPSYGPKDARLIVVGESPGQQEGFLGRPFVGKTGDVLRLLLERAGFDPATEVYYTNTVLCEPKGYKDKAKEQVMRDATAACGDRLTYALQQFIEDVPVLALGAWANKRLGLSYNRWETEVLTGKNAIGTDHPALAMYSDNGGGLTYVERVIDKLQRPRQYSQLPTEQLAINLVPSYVPDFVPICVDIETNNKEWWDPESRIAWLGISFIYEGKYWEYIWDQQFLYKHSDWLYYLWLDHYQQIGGHNFKFDNLFLAKELGIPLRFGWDTMLMLNILDGHWIKDLKSACGFYFDTPDWSQPLKEHLAQKPKGHRTYADADPEVIVPYLHHDIHFNLELYYTLRIELERVGRWDRPYKRFEIPLSNELARMEWRGFRVDLDKVAEETEALQEDIDAIAKRARTESNEEIANPNSYKQVGEHLYGTLGLRHTARGLDRTSTAEGALVTLDETQYPIVHTIRAYRRVSKLSSSYLRNLLRLVVGTSDNLYVCHPSAKQAHVITGRLSFAKPSIQNIPKKNDLKDAGAAYGQRVKNCYVARPGYVLLAVDGSQWELRVAAAWSMDQWLLDAYNSGMNVHSVACDMMWGPGWDSAMRTKEKNVMFGLVYGGTLLGIIASAGIKDRASAQRVYDFFSIELHGLMDWREEMFELARQNGEIVSPYFNRSFQFPFIHKGNEHNIRKYAVNWPIQGTASNITLEALVQAAPAIRELGGGFVATVHDSIIPEVPLGKEREAARIVVEKMERVGAQAFPVVAWEAEAEIGFTWGDMIDYDWRLYA